MIKSILFTIVCAIAVVSGGVLADFMKADNENETPVSIPTENEKADSTHKDKAKKKEKGGHGKSDKKGLKSDEVNYLKFRRQFVVPVMSGGDVDSLVLLNLNVELNSEAPSDYLSYEPKFRDSFMKDLLALSNAGHFSESLTTSETYDLIQKTLIYSAKNVMSKGVSTVLIMDIVKQDQ